MILLGASLGTSRNARRYWHRLGRGILLCFMMFLTSFCAGSAPNEPANGYRVQCITEITKCGTEHKAVAVSVQPLVPALPECHKVRTDLTTGTGAFVYCDVGNGGWVFQWVPPKLRGALWIPTRFEERSLADVRDYMSIGWAQSALDDIEGVYVAYDSRTTSKPNWLTDQFYPYIDPQTGNPYFVTTTMIDERDPASPFVQLELSRCT